MRIIRKIIKFGIPMGVVYYSVESDLWSPANENQKKMIVNYKESVRNVIGQYINVPLPEIPDAKSLWNSGVKKTFSSLSNIDIKDLMTKIEKLFQQKSK